ncbi:hypothetical protein [Acidovorax sp. SUPP3334]|uniref:hypothetical protein n=1 Tax=Acidovorax sp. SUPP3334 TaxID=2920881 RepID=UPI0023DE207D|nr:hypothetical protein [Acidovorax sp. SUPP3334]GKT22263.1 hypothetical protein AVHM3334_07770 [Acidovorax sp. SUPP3334]
MTRTTQSFHAPATRYVFQRSRLVGWFIVSALFSSAGGLVAWMGQASGDLTVQFILSWVLWAFVAASGWYFWRRLPSGFLQWDGLNWSLTAGDALPVAGVLVVHMDFQRFFLVHLSGLDGRSAWLCLERCGPQESWASLRRAVYSRPKPEPRADGVFSVRRGDA